MAELDEAVAQDPALAAQVAEYRRQNAALHEAFDAWLDEPVPPRLVDAARAPAPDPAGRWRRYAPHFAAAATLVLGVALGWFGREALLEREGTPTTFARQAALTHVLYASDVNRPVEIWAAEEQRLVRWLSRRLGLAVHAPDLNSFGYALVGGRLVAGNQKPAAMFIYENASKQRLSLMVRKHVLARERRRFVTPSKTASASITGSTRTARTRCRARSIARRCSRSAASCTASSRQPTLRPCRASSPRRRRVGPRSGIRP